MKPTGTDVRHATRRRPVEPFAIVTVVPCPGSRYGVSERIKATLLSMQPGSDDSFLADDRSLVYRVAKEIGVDVTSRPEDGKARVWRLA